MPVPNLLERHYSVPELALSLNVSDDTVRNLFLGEPGVLKIGKPTRLLGGRKKRRGYTVLRIPESVLLRVRQRLVAR